VQVATAEWDVQKPKVIIAKKELTAVLLSFDPFRNVRVSVEHAAINGLTGRESNEDIRPLDMNQVGKSPPVFTSFCSGLVFKRHYCGCME
jgi:hypothetical protein